MDRCARAKTYTIAEGWVDLFLFQRIFKVSKRVVWSCCIIFFDAFLTSLSHQMDYIVALAAAASSEWVEATISLFYYAIKMFTFEEKIKLIGAKCCYELTKISIHSMPFKRFVFYGPFFRLFAHSFTRLYGIHLLVQKWEKPN